MRDITELLDFLAMKMSMAAVYQPVVILHLLTRGGFASRTELARTLSGYDDFILSHWDRVLMKNPKLTLCDTHKIIVYNRDAQSFSLNFDLSDTQKVITAQDICEHKIEKWITREIQNGKLSEDEVLHYYRVLEIAKRGDYYSTTEVPFAVEEFAMQVAIREARCLYSAYKITQQPYDNPGFDILVGMTDQPVLYIKVKATQALTPSFRLSEGERQFSIDKSDQYRLILIYGITAEYEDYKMIWHDGALTHNDFSLVPVEWKCKALPVAELSK